MPCCKSSGASGIEYDGGAFCLLQSHTKNWISPPLVFLRNISHQFFISLGLHFTDLYLQTVEAWKCSVIKNNLLVYTKTDLTIAEEKPTWLIVLPASMVKALWRAKQKLIIPDWDYITEVISWKQMLPHQGYLSTRKQTCLDAFSIQLLN